MNQYIFIMVSPSGTEREAYASGESLLAARALIVEVWQGWRIKAYGAA